ncbi:MucR family transcriptional regulator [Methylobacterium sp. Gmos1]
MSDIVSAYVSNNSVPVGELSSLIRSVHEAIARLGSAVPAEPERLTPPVPIKKTVSPDYLISLEDGRRYRTLKRHLAGRGLTPEQYRQKWGLPPDYPMVAANYAAQRSELAKSIGLGQKPVVRRPRSNAA